MQHETKETQGKRFVVLDRDGTIIYERHYLSEPGQIRLLPKAVEGIRKMRALGLGVIIITNQSGIGRKYFNESRLNTIHQELSNLLAFQNIYLDGIYYCPHIPEDHCTCRKPETGLLELAGDELNFNPTTTFVIGDKSSDIGLGHRMGATTFWVSTGYAFIPSHYVGHPPDYSVNNLLEAANIIEKLVI